MNTIPNARGYRVDNIDMLRGLVIVIMALDHVRDYFMVAAEQDPMANPDVGIALFFTRWITHVCAPVFVFLAGTSAGLMMARKSPSKLGGFLFKRGCWLIVVEWFVISTAFTFAPGGVEQMRGLVLIPMQVIWAIGASMVVLAGVQFFGRRACLLSGIVIVLGHNLLDAVWPSTSAFGEGAAWWAALHSQAGYASRPFFFVFAYPLLPWMGVMFLDFGIAGVFEESPTRRDSLLVTWGIVATAGFLVIRTIDVYGDPSPWQLQESVIRTVIDFLNVTKYPPSLLFLLMTLGPAAVLCAFASHVPNAVKQPLIIFGRVPFAFYVVHLYLIHILSLGLGLIQGFDVNQFLTIMFFYPKGFGLSLSGVYAVWLIVIAMLYPFSKWVTSIKARRRDWWLSYV
jgi:uncharacterized membrane protein